MTQHYVYIILIKHTSFTGKGIAYGTEFPFASATTSSTEGPEPGMDIAPPILSLSRTLEIRFFTKKSEDISPKVKSNPMSGKGGAKKTRPAKKLMIYDSNAPSSESSNNNRAKEKLRETLKNASNVKSQKQMFLDLILSKDFEFVLNDIFDTCAGISERNVGGTESEKLDSAELKVAIKAIYKKLEDMAGKDMKLPKIKEPIDDILRSYDENNDGYLDKREFQGFARTYFSRMEWPLWKTAAKGAAKGVGFHMGVQFIVAPIVALCSPLIFAFAQREMKKITGEQLENVKDEFSKRFHALNVFGKDADGDGINDDVERIERKQKWQRRMKKSREVVATTAVASAAACAGLL